MISYVLQSTGNIWNNIYNGSIMVCDTNNDFVFANTNIQQNEKK